MPSSRKLVSRFPLHSSRLNRRFLPNRRGTANILILFVMHCMGLTRATYILCIEHLRLMHLIWESKNRTRDLLHCRQTLSAKRHSNGVINCYSEPVLVLLQLPPKAAMSQALLDWDCGWVWLRCGYIGHRRRGVWIEREGAWRSKHYCMRGSRALELQKPVWELLHVGVTTMKGPDPGQLHPLHRASETDVSQSGIEPGTSCTAG